jgi:hypothetical protein
MRQLAVSPPWCTKRDTPGCGEAPTRLLDLVGDGFTRLNRLGASFSLPETMLYAAFKMLGVVQKGKP